MTGYVVQNRNPGSSHYGKYFTGRCDRNHLRGIYTNDLYAALTFSTYRQAAIHRQCDDAVIDLSTGRYALEFTLRKRAGW